MIPQLFALLACRSDDPGPGAIEITGYLDASRVAVTAGGGVATALGLEAAAPADVEVALENHTTGAVETTTASDFGAFVVAVAAEVGDQLSVTVDGAPPDDALAVDVVPAEPFPVPTHLLAYPDPEEPALAAIELRFDPGLLDGVAWAANPETGAVALLDPLDGGTLHSGRLPAAEGDALVLTWVVHEPSEPVTVEVTHTP